MDDDSFIKMGGLTICGVNSSLLRDRLYCRWLRYTSLVPWFGSYAIIPSVDPWLPKVDDDPLLGGAPLPLSREVNFLRSCKSASVAWLTCISPLSPPTCIRLQTAVSESSVAPHFRHLYNVTRSGNAAGGGAGGGNGETCGERAGGDMIGASTAGDVATPVCGAPGTGAGVGNNMAIVDMDANTGDVYA